MTDAFDGLDVSPAAFQPDFDPAECARWTPRPNGRAPCPSSPWFAMSADKARRLVATILTEGTPRN